MSPPSNFDSFDESPLGAFIESQLGVRGFDEAPPAPTYNAFVTGGHPDAYDNYCEGYDPVGDAWATFTVLLKDRRQHSSGNVDPYGYIMMGRNGSTYNDVDRFDISGGSPGVWTNMTAVASPARRLQSGEAVLEKIYCGGGWNGSTYFTDLDEYNPSGDIWTGKADVPIPARRSAYTFVISDLMYYIAGEALATVVNKDNDQYNSVSNTWTAKMDTPDPARREGRGVTLLGYGYIYGGITAAIRIKDNDRYDPIGDSWTGKQDLLTQLSLFAATAINDKGYIYGGLTNTGGTSLTRQYDPVGDSWSTKASMFSTRYQTDAMNMGV